MSSTSQAGGQSHNPFDPPRTVLAMVVCIVVGEGSLICMPFIVGGIVERYQLAEAAAGFVTSLQFIRCWIIKIEYLLIY